MAFNIYILLTPFIFVSLFFGVGILFVRKKYRLWFERFRFKENALDIIIITKNRNLFHGVVGISQQKFKYNNQEYLIDEECIYTEKFKLAQRPYSIYLEGNPKPLKFDFKTLKADISSQNLKDFVESNLIQQLLNTDEDKIKTFILIVSILTLAGVGIAIYLIITKFDTIIDILSKL
jgi:hypothetical protein